MSQASKPVPSPKAIQPTSSTNASCYVVSNVDGLNIRDQPRTDSTALAQLQKGDRLDAKCDAVEGGSYSACGVSNYSWWIPVHYDDRNADAYVAAACVGWYASQG
ncbi:MAG: SH3 domain-containing protein [Ktedonobacteraceae bacterium]|nr:SH3 domain-containing protein [Ktedonobacteraceae bacterium]